MRKIKGNMLGKEEEKELENFHRCSNVSYFLQERNFYRKRKKNEKRFKEISRYNNNNDQLNLHSPISQPS